jgi:hypothetical protein
MATVVISPSNVVNFVNGGGGHFWVYLQYALGLKDAGCDVYWLERVVRSDKPDEDARAVAAFSALLEKFGLGGKAILYPGYKRGGEPYPPREYFGMSTSAAEEIFRRADLLLNFHYSIDPALLACFRRTALVDIDPGLLQHWIGEKQLTVARHDLYLTTGETVGTPAARFPDAGVTWHHIRPSVYLDLWPYTFNAGCEAFTTVSNWFGHADWIIAKDGTNYENTKRIAFLEFVELPRRTRQPLELAVYLSDEPPDQRDRSDMESHGWRIRHSLEVSQTPQMYQSYIQNSRGEFSCAKPSCIKFQNAWVSDRTLCYLSSGKPAVVQHTGESAFLPSGEGLFRFKTLTEAADALETVNSDYERHCCAARDIAASLFDARDMSKLILNLTLR